MQYRQYDYKFRLGFWCFRTECFHSVLSARATTPRRSVFPQTAWTCRNKSTINVDDECVRCNVSYLFCARALSIREQAVIYLNTKICVCRVKKCFHNNLRSAYWDWVGTRPFQHDNHPVLPNRHTKWRKQGLAPLTRWKLYKTKPFYCFSDRYHGAVFHSVNTFRLYVRHLFKFTVPNFIANTFRVSMSVEKHLITFYNDRRNDRPNNANVQIIV